MKKTYSHITRDYEVSNEGLPNGTVIVTTKIRDTGEVVDVREMPTNHFPEFINSKRLIIFPEEICRNPITL